MVPGMAHCRGGPGPTSFGGLSTIASPQNEIDPEHDVLSALIQWVEKGSAPDHIITAHFTNGSVDRTRPLCPYPKVGRWHGSGSSDDAKNFACVEPARSSPNRSTKEEVIAIGTNDAAIVPGWPARFPYANYGRIARHPSIGTTLRGSAFKSDGALKLSR